MAVKHYRKILVPLDGLDRAEAVLVHAITIARCSDGEIILLRVPLYANGQEGSPALAAVHGYAPRPLKGDREKALEESRRYLNKVRTNLVRLGVKVFVPVQAGEAPPRIIEYALEAKVDLVAMATHGRDGGPAWIAYEGRAYDVSLSFLWQGCIHDMIHSAGADLSAEFPQAPHGAESLERSPFVGFLDPD